MTGRRPLLLPSAGSRSHEILVGNAAHVMLMWEVARLRQIDFDLFRGIRASASKTGGSVRDTQGETCRRAAKRLREISGEWKQHSEMLAHYAAEYREEVDSKLPFDLEELFDYLREVDVDVASMAKGVLEERQEQVMRVAALAGLRRAEISISVASAALSVLGQSTAKQCCDLATQAKMMVLDGTRRRARLEDGVRRSVGNRWLARRSADIDLMAVCSMRHGVPCAVWRIYKE